MTEKNTRAGRAFFINSIWAVGARISINSLGAISIIFLARILTPDDYGIVAQAVMIIGNDDSIRTGNGLNRQPKSN